MCFQSSHVAVVSPSSGRHHGAVDVSLFTTSIYTIFVRPNMVAGTSWTRHSAYNYRATTNTDNKLSPVKRSSLMQRLNRNAFRGPLEVRWWWQKVTTTTKPDVPRWPILLVPRFG